MLYVISRSCQGDWRSSIMCCAWSTLAHYLEILALIDITLACTIVQIFVFRELPWLYPGLALNSQWCARINVRHEQVFTDRLLNNDLGHASAHLYNFKVSCAWLRLSHAYSGLLLGTKSPWVLRPTLPHTAGARPLPNKTTLFEGSTNLRAWSSATNSTHCQQRPTKITSRVTKRIRSANSCIKSHKASRF